MFAEREDVGRVLQRRVALDGAGAGNLVEEDAHLVEGRRLKLAALGVLDRAREHVHDLLRLAAQLLLRNQLVAKLAGLEAILDPEIDNLVVTFDEQVDDGGRVVVLD